jgi:hypothetical protein
MYSANTGWPGLVASISTGASDNSVTTFSSFAIIPPNEARTLRSIKATIEKAVVRIVFMLLRLHAWYLVILC